MSVWLLIEKDLCSHQLKMLPRQETLLQRKGEGGSHGTVLRVCRQRKAVEDQISHFGQTPSQLFRRKHPRRGPPPPPSAHPLLNGPDAMKLSTVGMPPSRRRALGRLLQCSPAEGPGLLTRSKAMSGAMRMVWLSRGFSWWQAILASA